MVTREERALNISSSNFTVVSPLRTGSLSLFPNRIDFASKAVYSKPSIFTELPTNFIELREFKIK